MNDYQSSTRFGAEATIYEDANKSVRITENIRDYHVFSAFKHVVTRIKVHSQQQEHEQYLAFSRYLAEARAEGRLLLSSNDPSLRPSFSIDFPKMNYDGSYFVITSYTEVIM